MLILGGAAVLAYLMLNKKPQPVRKTTSSVGYVGGRFPVVNFASDPNSIVTGVNYYANNPSADPVNEFMKQIGFGY